MEALEVLHNQLQILVRALQYLIIHCYSGREGKAISVKNLWAASCLGMELVCKSFQGFLNLTQKVCETF